MTVLANRVLDAGGPFPLWAPTHGVEGPACGHGVYVEMPLVTPADAHAGEVTLFLRHADKAGTTSLKAHGERIAVALSLATGRCTPRDEAAQRFVAGVPWLTAEIDRQLEWLRERAARAVAQRDRSSCDAVLARRTDTLMISYEELFPSDWDLLVPHGGETYWVADQYCPNVACPCVKIVVQVYRLHGERTHLAGTLTLDLRAPDQRPEATTPLAASLFGPIWKRYGDELARRREEVRAAVQRAPARTRPTSAAPSRNGPCPCGSGRKYKRRCAAATDAGGGPR